MRRYNCSLNDLLFESVNNSIESYVFHLSDENMRCNASFLFELILISNGRMRVCQNDDLFLYEDLQCFIDYICTS
jgi:hypothetical protein